MSWSVSCERFRLTAGPELRPPPPLSLKPFQPTPTKETCRKHPELNLDTIPIFKIASYLGTFMKLISYSTDLHGGQWIFDHESLSQNTIRMPRWSQLTVSLLSDVQSPCPHNLSPHPIVYPRRAVQPPCHLPTLFFHMPNLLEHIPALLSLLLVVLPSSSSASHIPILLDLITYSSTLSPVRAAQPPCPLTQSLLSDGQPLCSFTCSSQLSSHYPTVFSLQTSCLPHTISSQPSYLPS